jgi:hypothetical protein
MLASGLVKIILVVFFVILIIAIARGRRLRGGPAIRNRRNDAQGATNAPKRTNQTYQEMQKEKQANPGEQ